MAGETSAGDLQAAEGAGAPDHAPDGSGVHAESRRARLGVLARADMVRLKELWSGLGMDPVFRAIRGPETGLVALRGRMGGTGAAFNFGEATVTRATVRLDDGPAAGAVGHAILLGRDHGKARLVAVIDALATQDGLAQRIEAELVAPLRAETAASKVDFFTVARGED